MTFWTTVKVSRRKLYELMVTDFDFIASILLGYCQCNFSMCENKWWWWWGNDAVSAQNSQVVSWVDVGTYPHVLWLLAVLEGTQLAASRPPRHLLTSATDPCIRSTIVVVEDTQATGVTTSNTPWTTRQAAGSSHSPLKTPTPAPPPANTETPGNTYPPVARVRRGIMQL